MLTGLTVAGLLCPVTPKAKARAFQKLTPHSTIMWDVSRGPVAEVTLTGDHVLQFTNTPEPGATYILIVKQGSGGFHTLDYESRVSWQSGEAPSLSVFAGEIDIISFVSDGQNIYAVEQLGFE